MILSHDKRQEIFENHKPRSSLHICLLLGVSWLNEGHWLALMHMAICDVTSCWQIATNERPWFGHMTWSMWFEPISSLLFSRPSKCQQKTSKKKEVKIDTPSLWFAAGGINFIHLFLYEDLTLCRCCHEINNIVSFEDIFN